MLKQYAQEHLDEQFVIHSFSCAENLIRELSQSPQGYDLYLLDIIMEGRIGIEPVSYTHLDVYKRQANT